MTTANPTIDQQITDSHAELLETSFHHFQVSMGVSEEEMARIIDEAENEDLW
jgi:hypothetical protein